MEVLPGAQLRLDDYTPRTGYTGKLLAGNKSFYDLLGDKTLRELDLSQFDHEWSLAAVVAGAGHTSYRQGYVYDLYDRGLGAPPAPPLTSPALPGGLLAHGLRSCGMGSYFPGRGRHVVGQSASRLQHGPAARYPALRLR